MSHETKSFMIFGLNMYDIESIRNKSLRPRA
jgi:hypothetical protein